MQTKVNITLLGGNDTVGGNTVLLEDFDYGVKILIDFGINMKKYNENYKYKEFPQSIKELIEKEIIPNPDYLSIDNIYLNEGNSTNLDAILISHAHRDHNLCLSFINRNIPVHTGVVTQKIIKANYKTSSHSIINNLENINWQLFRTNDIISIKDLMITPFHVDHSIPASYGFIIYSSVGPIIYSGDFRRHGPLSFMTEEFIEETQNHSLFKANNATDNFENYPFDNQTLICEGTKISKGMIESEKMVENHLDILFKRNPFDFILSKYDRIDWDRFRTFSTIAKKNDWKYIIEEKDAYFYYLLNKDAIHDTMRNPNILDDNHIYILKRGDVEFDWQKELRQKIYKSGLANRFLEYKDLIKLKEKFFIYITFLYRDLKDFIMDLSKSHRGCFISSSIDPYAEEYFDNTSSIRKKLSDMGIPTYRIQASGHSTPHDIIDYIEKINPKNLIPIHTENPEMFDLLFRNSKIHVYLPQKYDNLELS